MTSPVAVSRKTLRGGDSLGDRWGPPHSSAFIRRDTRELRVYLSLSLSLFSSSSPRSCLSVIFSFSFSVSLPPLMSIKKATKLCLGDYKHAVLDKWSLMVENDL